MKSKMDSTKSKSTAYSLLKDKAIGQVLLVPEGGHFRIYVAWEWEDMAKKGFFAVCKSPQLYRCKNIEEAINEVADYGTDITGSPEAKRLFANLF